MIVKGKARRFIIQAIRHYIFVCQAARWHLDEIEDNGNFGMDEAYYNVLLKELEKEEHK